MFGHELKRKTEQPFSIVAHELNRNTEQFNINDYDTEVYSVSLLWCISCIGLWCYMKDDQVVRLQIEYKLLSRRDSGGYELAVTKKVNQPRLRAVMNQEI